MGDLRVWSYGNPEPYPWPDVRDNKDRKWVSGLKGWHLDPVDPVDCRRDRCVSWANLTKLHGPITPDSSTFRAD
jgi:hypothetical protein